jgi:hypothetical protein
MSVTRSREYICEAIDEKLDQENGKWVLAGEGVHLVANGRRPLTQVCRNKQG